jgi:hypothetical protein
VEEEEEVDAKTHPPTSSIVAAVAAVEGAIST